MMRRARFGWMYDLVFLVIFLGAGWLRFSGLQWGEYSYLHPDERFLVWVTADLRPVESLGEYFDTAHSTLNPVNQGHGFFVYGTLPLFITRYTVNAIYPEPGWNEIQDVGRTLSALADLGVVLLVYLIGRRTADERLGLLAAAFSAVAVLQIQQAHFYTVDSFVNLFSTLAIYLAVVIATLHTRQRGALLSLSVGFGVALGCAVASKLLAAPVAVALPTAMAVLYMRRRGRLDIEDRDDWRLAREMMGVLVLAALTSLVIFRLAQPYTFSGPGFFNLWPDEKWLAGIQEQRAQAGINVDFPPAMQWARRPVTFSLGNMVVWGMGLPLGGLAWAGFLLAGALLLRQAWARRRGVVDAEGERPPPELNLGWWLLWLWTAGYFTWQSLQFNPTMRYQLPIYPTLELFAALAVVWLVDRGATATRLRTGRWLRLAGWAGLALGAAVLTATALYAFAFNQIYLRPMTRVAASRWIYENIPGPINLSGRTISGEARTQILPFSEGVRLQNDAPYRAIFTPRWDGTLDQVLLPRAEGQINLTQPVTFTVSLASADQPEAILASASTRTTLNGAAGQAIGLEFAQPAALTSAVVYQLEIRIEAPQAAAFNGAATVYITPHTGQPGGLITQTIRPEARGDSPFAPFVLLLTPQANGSLSQIHLMSAIPGAAEQPPPLTSLSVTPDRLDEPEDVMRSNLAAVQNPALPGGIYVLDQPIPLLQGELYRVVLNAAPSAGGIGLAGMGIATEGEWDDNLPTRLDGYDGYGGIYPNDLTFNMYWDDNPAKLERMLRILDAADYVVISSNRQWGTLPRIPERFPLTTLYYRQLMGCPADQDVVDCYRQAEPGKYRGGLGFELERVFVSPPCLGPLCLNDQFAEEAFTVYDHPQVLVFHKTDQYRPEHVREVLGTVDFDQIIKKPPLQYSAHPENLMLPSHIWARQQAGGTWRELFNPQDWINRSQPLAVGVWYLAVWFLGLLAYPMLRAALPALGDRGYPLSRTAGLLLLGWLTWMSASYGVAFSRASVGGGVLLMAAISTGLVYRQRAELRAELRQHWRRYLAVELAALALFGGFLLVRLGNPDLWHPWKGGERPMDFSYFNAILKSTTFPPYDPWFAGGYLNYYYFGFVMMGTLVKFLGITPAVAYNLLLPTACSLIGLGAYSAGWNLHTAFQGRRSRPAAARISPYIPAIAALVFVTLLGNLGTVRMFYQGFQRLAVDQSALQDGNLIQRWAWGVEGFAKALAGEKLPYSVGDWYWLPSRAIPAPNDVEPITEFPYFTLLYGDPHAHLWALPLTLLALGGVIGLVLSRRRLRLGQMAGWLALMGLTIGALRTTNTWDMPTYLALAGVGVVYTVLSNGPISPYAWLRGWLSGWPDRLVRLAVALGALGLLVGLSFWLFRPYGQWYALGYTKVRLWEGSTTPLYSYFVHWGVFLFLIVAWVIYETIDWMKSTPATALRKLAPWRPVIIAAMLGVVLATITLAVIGASIAWFVVPLGVWVTLLLLRGDQSTARRIVLFLVGSGLMLTLLVEMIVLEGDIGRMNTVFKFYLQVWVIFGVSAAAAFGWTLENLSHWRPRWSAAWQIGAALLISSAALFTAMATLAKIDDRMAPSAPHTLDGMAYMAYAGYTDTSERMDLSQDYHAIRWLQEHVDGSPVIVEANLRELYRWGSRMTIYTGLPGVVGWEWHQQQQRTAAIPGEWVSRRIAEIDQFYQTEDLAAAEAFLRKYEVAYIIVGQQERGRYAGAGLDKFAKANGALWREVFRLDDTVIYEVIR